jgi:isopropylmalate/homocitrate/citramalate synthase
MRETVGIREVGPREALQAVAEALPTDRKIELIRRLIACGFRSLNAVSLVSPKAMPHMADAEAVLEGIGPVPGVAISALTPNARALSRAASLAGRGLLDEVFFVHATTSSVLTANGLPGSLDANFSRITELSEQAKAGGLRVGVFVSAAFGCSMEGRVNPDRVMRIVEALRQLSSVDEIVISDSTGQADPSQVARLLDELAPVIDDSPCTVHFHDSRGTGLANAVAAIASPIINLTLDTSFGGLGGDIPFIPEAAGNVATEDLVAMLDGMGVSTGVDAAGVAAVAGAYREWSSVPLRSHIADVGPVRWKAAPLAG